MPTWAEWEMEIFCTECDAEWIVTGKELSASRDVPCPDCGAVMCIDIWDRHRNWAFMAKLLGWK